MLDIQILGSPEILWDDQPVQIPRRIPRSILYYLSTFQHPVSRAEIVTVFWPEVDDRSARDALRDNLAKLRKSLPDPNLIHADHLTISLEQSMLRVDYQLFQQLANWIGRQPWQVANDVALPVHLVSQMEKAISLWRAPRMLYGANLPDSQALDEWLGSIEQSMYVKRDRIQDRLIRHYLITGNYDASLRCIDFGLSADPTNEELHLLKLDTLARSGQRSEAIRYGQYVQDLFQKEFHEKQSSQFSQALNILKNEQNQSDSTRPFALQTLGNNSIPFIGRKDQLNLMKSAILSGQVILIDGDLGSGKTSLVKELIKQLQPALRILPAACHPSTRVIPFQPLIEMIRTSIHPEEISSLDLHDQSCLSLLDPVFHLSKTSNSEHPKSLTTDHHPWIHESIFHLIRSVTRVQKGLLFLDNAESADDATLTTCRIMAKNRFLFTNACLVMTRTKGMQNAILDEFVNDLTSQNRLAHIHLEPFSLLEEKELIETILNQVINDKEFEQIHRDTAGNPLLIIERLRSTNLGDEPSFGHAISVSLRAVLREHYLKFSPEMQTVAALIALTDTPLQMEIIETASQIPGEGAIRAIEELERQAIILSEEDVLTGSLTYQYRQNIVQETVKLELSPTRKRLLRRRLAAAIETRMKENIEKRAAILAELYESCGDFEKAFLNWNLNAEYAKKLSSPGDATRSFQRAQKILPNIEEVLSDEQIINFYRSWSDLAYFSSDTVELWNIHQSLLKFGENRSSAPLLGDSLACLANQQFSLKKYAEGLETTELALRYYQEAGLISRWLTSINRKAKCLYMLSRFQEASQVIEFALATIPEEKDDAIRAVEANLLYDSAVVWTLLGFPLKSIQQAEKSLKYFMQAHEIEGQAKVYGVLTLAHVLNGQIRKAESEGLLGLQLAERINYKRMQGYIHAYLSQAKTGMGKLDDAWLHASKAREIGIEYDYPEILALAERSNG